MEEEDRGMEVAGGEAKNRAIDYEKLERDVEEQHDVALKQGKLTEALDALLNLEKQMRLAADVVGTKMVAIAILRICHEAAAWKQLNDQIVALSKRRAQLKQVVAAMVQEAMKFVDTAPDDTIREALIKTLTAVTAGKIYVEIERARLVKRLARMKENEGKVKDAAETMQEVAVETFGAMAKTEKIAFILEQVRLCLDSADFMRAQILAKKISPRAFASESAEKAAAAAAAGGEKVKERKGPREEGAVQAADADVPSLMALKLKYYELMIRYYTHMGDYLEICRCYKHIYDTPDVKANADQWMPVLKHICWYLVLSPYDSMQSSLLHSTYNDPHLSDIPKFKSLLKAFITMEVVAWPQLQSDYASEMQEAQEAVFASPKAHDHLRLRVIQHNILVVSKYYVRITMKRLSELLALPTDEAEKHLCDMVVGKVLHARVDRPAGIITFTDRQAGGTAMLDTWAAGIGQLLDLVETSCHHIHKEAMVHKLALKA